VPDIYFAM